MEYIKTAFSSLNLDKADYESYRIIFHGKQIQKKEDFRYDIEIFLYPNNFHSYSDIEYQADLILRRTVAINLIKWLPIGAIFDRNNILIGHYGSKRFLRNISIGNKMHKFISKPNFISSDRFLSPKELEKIGISDLAPTKSLQYMPCIKVHLFEKELNVKFIIPCIELTRFFLFENIKITDKLMNGSFLNDISGVSRIIIEENNKQTGFVSIRSGYSEREKQVLAWISLSNEVFRMAKNILRSVVIPNPINEHFLTSKLPTNDDIDLAVRGFYINKECFFCEKIVQCSNIFPIKDVIYSYIVDNRSTNDENYKATLEEKQYSPLAPIKAPLMSKDKRISISENASSQPQQSEYRPNIDIVESSFFDQNPLNLISLPKANQDYVYKGKFKTVTISEDEFTTSEQKSVNGTAIKIIQIIEKQRMEISENDQRKFIKSLMLELENTFLVNKIYSGYESKFILLDVVNESDHFYLLEKIGQSSFDGRIILIYDQNFSEINSKKLLSILSALSNLNFTREIVSTEAEKYALSIRGFNHCEGNAFVTPKTMSDKIEKFIEKPKDKYGNNIKRTHF